MLLLFNCLLLSSVISCLYCSYSLLTQFWSLLWSTANRTVVCTQWRWLRANRKTIPIPEDAKLTIRHEHINGLQVAAIRLQSAVEDWDVRLVYQPKTGNLNLTNEMHRLAVTDGKDLATKLGLDLVEGGVSLLQPKVRLPDAD